MSESLVEWYAKNYFEQKGYNPDRSLEIACKYVDAFASRDLTDHSNPKVGALRGAANEMILTGFFNDQLSFGKYSYALGSKTKESSGVDIMGRVMGGDVLGIGVKLEHRPDPIFKRTPPVVNFMIPPELSGVDKFLTLQQKGNLMLPEEFVHERRYVQPHSILSIVGDQISQIARLNEWKQFPDAKGMLKDLQKAQKAQKGR